MFYNNEYLLMEVFVLFVFLWILVEGTLLLIKLMYNSYKDYVNEKHRLTYMHKCVKCDGPVWSVSSKYHRDRSYCDSCKWVMFIDDDNLVKTINIKCSNIIQN